MTSSRSALGERVRSVALFAGLVAATLLAACGSSGDADQTETASTGPGERAAASADVFADLDPAGPGCAAAVTTEAGDHLAEFGVTDVAEGDAIKAETVFDVGSVSKQITAGAVALLVVRGELELDEDITDLVPELGPGPETITVADLLHHTSGLPDYVELLDADVEEVTTAVDALAVLTSAEGRPRFVPGELFEYSNTNYLLLARIVEEISDRSFPEFAAAEVFEPLGMDDSIVRDDQGDLLDDQAAGYEDQGDGAWIEVGSAWRQTGDGAVHTTAADLLLWADLFVADAAVGDLGSDAWLDVMLEPGPVRDGDVGYAGGLEISSDEDDDLTLSHGGSWIGYGSAIAMDPDAGVAAVVACNIDGIDAEDRAAELLTIWSRPS